MAGWAQIRHTRALQAEESSFSFGMVDGAPVGFVEPNPDFFRHLGLLASTMARQLDRYDALEITASDCIREARDLLPAVKELAWIVEQLRKLPREEFDKAFEGDYTAKEKAVCEKLQVLSASYEVRTCVNFDRGGKKATSIWHLEDLVEVLGRIANGDRVNEIVLQSRSFSKGPLRDRWRKLVKVCFQLESISQRQLRGLELQEEQVRFMKGYGEALASIMLYDGNSWVHARDDAPRVAAVFNQPGEGFLLAGVSHPREIRVLYPWQGKEIECRGAVLPYYEMRSDRHMSDEEWRGLAGEKLPPVPDWLRPVVAD